MKQIERLGLLDAVCCHVKAGRCNLKKDVIILSGGAPAGGSPCIRWDHGELIEGVRFRDCPDFEEF